MNKHDEATSPDLSEPSMQIEPDEAGDGRASHDRTNELRGVARAVWNALEEQDVDLELVQETDQHTILGATTQSGTNYSIMINLTP